MVDNYLPIGKFAGEVMGWEGGGGGGGGEGKDVQRKKK